MVGGGRGAFIGGVHRLCARMDGEYELVAGALSSDPQRAKESGADLGLAPDRVYTSYADMATAEAHRAGSDGIEVVSIVTPNDSHHAVARAFLDRGIDVICDKPMTTTVEDALDLVQAVRRTGLIFGVTHNYTGYPMVRQAREMIAAGELGTIRVVQVEYVASLPLAHCRLRRDRRFCHDRRRGSRSLFRCAAGSGHGYSSWGWIATSSRPSVSMRRTRMSSVREVGTFLPT